VLLQSKDYAAAAALAFEMRQPRRLLSVVDAVLSTGSGNGAAAPGASAELLESLVASWDKWVLNSRFALLRGDCDASACSCCNCIMLAFVKPCMEPILYDLLEPQGAAASGAGVCAGVEHQLAAVPRGAGAAGRHPAPAPAPGQRSPSAMCDAVHVCSHWLPTNGSASCKNDSH
jgi:Utp13 specific WD40 associated domain